MERDWDPLGGGCEWPRDKSGLATCGNTATAIVLNGATWFRPVCGFHREVAKAARWTVYDPDERRGGDRAYGAAGPDQPRRRKLRRFRRPDTADLPDKLLLLRASPATWAATWADIAAEARRCGDVYAVDAGGDEPEVLFGVSVLALRPGVDPIEVLAPFDLSPSYLEISVADLRRAGFAILATRGPADRFEIQLLGGHGEKKPDPGEAIDIAAARLAGAGTLRDNPAFPS